MSRKKLPVKPHSLGARIEEALKVRNLTRVELAKSTGISRPYISQIITGAQQEPSPKIIQLIAHQLNVSVCWLDTGEGPMTTASTNSPADVPTVPEGILEKCPLAYDVDPETKRYILASVDYILDSKDATIIKALAQNVAAFRQAIDTKEQNNDFKTKVSQHERDIRETNLEMTMLKAELLKLQKILHRESQGLPGEESERSSTGSSGRRKK